MFAFSSKSTFIICPFLAAARSSRLSVAPAEVRNTEPLSSTNNRSPLDVTYDLDLGRRSMFQYNVKYLAL